LEEQLVTFHELPFVMSKRNAKKEREQKLVRKPSFLAFRWLSVPQERKRLALLCVTKLGHDDGKCLLLRGKLVALFVVPVMCHDRALLSRSCDKPRSAN
jgi:hypothetical protein